MKVLNGLPSVRGSRCGVLAAALLAASATADQLIVYDFGSDLTSTQRSAGVSMPTPLAAMQSGASWDSFEKAVRATGWKSTPVTNYYRFSFAVTTNTEIDIQRVEFDYNSANIMGLANGPSEYNVLAGTNGGPFVSLSGGWQSMSVDGAWHRGLTATNTGVGFTNLDGYVTIALAARGAKDASVNWMLDNIRVIGMAHASTRPTPPCAITQMSPAGTVTIATPSTQLYYAIQQNTNLWGKWCYCTNQANAVSTGTTLRFALGETAVSSRFFRAVSGAVPLPLDDVAGFWQVSSTNAWYREGVVRFRQSGDRVQYERVMLGLMRGHSVSMAEDGRTWMSAVISGDVFRASYDLPLPGASVQGTCTGSRYQGPVYAVWQGSNALTSAQFYNPGSNGYSLVGAADTTATFAVSSGYVVIAANTLAPVDAIQGSTGSYLTLGMVGSFWAAGATGYTNAFGPPDGVPALVGDGYSNYRHRGYLAFPRPAWTSITVHVIGTSLSE